MWSQFLRVKNIKNKKMFLFVTIHYICVLMHVKISEFILVYFSIFQMGFLDNHYKDELRIVCIVICTFNGLVWIPCYKLKFHLLDDDRSSQLVLPPLRISQLSKLLKHELHQGNNRQYIVIISNEVLFPKLIYHFFSLR